MTRVARKVVTDLLTSKEIFAGLVANLVVGSTKLG